MPLLTTEMAFGGGECAAGAFQFGFFVSGEAGAQFAEDGDDAADFFQRWFFRRQLHRVLVAFHTAAHDVGFFVERRRQRQDDGVEAAFLGRWRGRSRLCRGCWRWR